MYHTFLTLKGGFLAIEKCFSLPTGEVGGGASDDPTSPHRRGVTTNVDWDGGSGPGTTSPRRQTSRSLDWIKRSRARRESRHRGARLVPPSLDLEMLDEGTA
jgi:hypothetical protein